MPQPQTKSRSRPKPKTRSRAASSKPKKAGAASKASPSSKPKAAVEAVEETAKDAGRVVGNAAGKAGNAAGRASHVVGKARVPLMAGGAALAGVAGGIALGNRQAHRHRGLKSIDSDGVAKAARKVGHVGMQIGEIAVDARRAHEANGKAHRSPIEVVLQGLTSRQARS
ncbi:MAG TPA: hypothetical protein VFI03_05865 [Solirubrobacterales bacterium]|nr:hypothetical protein [Solirubrobacterales bacterium]